MLRGAALQRQGMDAWRRGLLQYRWLQPGHGPKRRRVGNPAVPLLLDAGVEPQNSGLQSRDLDCRAGRRPATASSDATRRAASDLRAAGPCAVRASRREVADGRGSWARTGRAITLFARSARREKSTTSVKYLTANPGTRRTLRRPPIACSSGCGSDLSTISNPAEKSTSLGVLLVGASRAPRGFGGWHGMG